MPRVHLVNPSTHSFGVAVITPRWLYVLAAATGTRWGDPHVVDETLDPLDLDTIAAGDVVGIGIHTGNALRGYKLGRELRQPIGVRLTLAGAAGVCGVGALATVAGLRGAIRAADTAVYGPAAETAGPPVVVPAVDDARRSA